MKINILTTKLAEALNFATKPVNRSTLQILECVKLAATSEGLVTVTGTDLDCEFSADAEYESGEAGEIVLNAEKLKRIIKAGNKAQISREQSGKALICVDDCSYEIPNDDEGAFPPALASRFANSCFVNAKQFIDGLKKVAPFMSCDESRYALNCVFVEVTESFVFLVATDSRTLAIHRIKRNDVGGACGDFVILSKVVSKMTEEDVSGGCQFSWKEGDSKHFGNIGIYTATKTVVSKQTDCNYPNYKKVIPAVTEKTFKVEVAATAFKKALSQVAAIVPSDRAVELQSGLSSSFTIATTKHQEGKAAALCPIKSASGVITAGGVYFNPILLLRAVEALSENVTIALNESLHAAMFSDKDTQVIVMPMRVTD